MKDITISTNLLNSAGSLQDRLSGRVKLNDNPEEKVGSFVSSLKGYMEKVNNDQAGADKSVENFIKGDNNLHETAIALEKADLSLRLMSNIRSKVIQAYQEVMRMGI